MQHLRQQKGPVTALSASFFLWDVFSRTCAGKKHRNPPNFRKNLAKPARRPEPNCREKPSEAVFRQSQKGRDEGLSLVPCFLVLPFSGHFAQRKRKVTVCSLVVPFAKEKLRPCDPDRSLFFSGVCKARQRKRIVHRQRAEQLLHYPFGDRADIQPFHEPDDPLPLLLGDMIRPQAHGENQP